MKKTILFVSLMQMSGFAGADTSDQLGAYVSLTRLTYSVCSLKVTNELRRANVYNDSPDSSGPEQCRDDAAKDVDKNFKKAKAALNKNKIALAALSSLHGVWQQGMLSLIPKDAVSVDGYSLKSDEAERRIVEAGDKLIVAYCKQDSACTLKVNAKLAE